MPDDPFLLVSLKEDKAKKLANVMANPTCTRILDHLAQAKEATESSIAKELKIPLSTVHYNLQQLVQAKLVVVEEFHYSPKGREVNHYKLANKYIIIAPKDDDPRFLERLKHLLPAALLTLGAAAILKTLRFFTPAANTFSATPIAAAPAAAPLADAAVQESAGALAQEAIAPAAAKVADTAVAESARALSAPAEDLAATAVQNATDVVTTAVNTTPTIDPTLVAQHVPWWQSPLIEWFLVGAGFVLLVLILGELLAHLRSRRKTRR